MRQHLHFNKSQVFMVAKITQTMWVSTETARHKFQDNSLPALELSSGSRAQYRNACVLWS
jgi:hypothetical protein